MTMAPYSSVMKVKKVLGISAGLGNLTFVALEYSLGKCGGISLCDQITNVWMDNKLVGLVF